jgi:PTH1 family peptidyl-tRNA hydrolase
MVISCSPSLALYLTPLSIVVFDNIHLPLGDIRMRPKGSSGGQNGVKHIIEQLKTEQFPRIAMGVGPVPKVRIRE